jgi:hypothetical protein
LKGGEGEDLRIVWALLELLKEEVLWYVPL